MVSYIIKEGFKNVLKNKKSTLISLVTMVCAMFLFGAFFSIGENVNSILYQVQKNQGIEVFIENDATDEQINVLEEKEGLERLSHYYATHYFRLIPYEEVARPKLIPDTWYKYSA